MSVPAIPSKPGYTTLRGASLAQIDGDHDLAAWAKGGYRVHSVVVISQGRGVVHGTGQYEWNDPEVEVLLEHASVRNSA